MMRETYQICVGTAQPSSAAMRHTHPVNHVNPVTFANADLTRTRPPRNSLACMDNPTVSAYICERGMRIAPVRSWLTDLADVSSVVTHLRSCLFCCRVVRDIHLSRRYTAGPECLHVFGQHFASIPRRYGDRLSIINPSRNAVRWARALMPATTTRDCDFAGP